LLVSAVRLFESPAGSEKRLLWMENRQWVVCSKKGNGQFAAVPGAQADMRVLLRQIRSGLLLQDEDRWTTDLERARGFRHSAEAMDFARKKHLKEVEVLLAFDTPRFDVGLPLP
jgi:hypothetical protein